MQFKDPIYLREFILSVIDKDKFDKLNCGKLLHEIKKFVEKKPEGDLKVGWRSIGVYPSRIGYISDALCDVILEEVENNDLCIDTVAGIALNGIPYAAFIADKLGLELSVFRPYHEKIGAFSSNYADVEDKNVIIVDDVVGSGDTFRSAIKAIKQHNATPVLCCAILNKRVQNEIQGIPLRALIRARVI